MKFIRIFLLVLIIIGIGLLCTQKIWVPKLVEKILTYQGLPVVSETSSTLKPDTYDWCIANRGKDLTPNFNAPKKCVLDNKIFEENCIKNDKYFVISNNLADSVGSDILVKYKSSPNQIISCEYVVGAGDFGIKNEWAEYLLALENNLLILDSGTSPDPRGLIIYDLSNRKKVYEDEYFSQSVKIQNNTIDYWRPTDIKVTAKNCPNLSEFEKNGTGEGIDSHVILNLSDFSLRELGEYRCTGRQ
jgi:hypothetical protein